MTPEKRTKLYMIMADLGTLSILLFAAARALGWPDFVQGLAIGMLVVSLAMLLVRKLRDEYVERLWASGTSLAFIMLVAWFVLAPFGEGFLDGLRGARRHSDVPFDLAPAFALAAFYVGFQWRRFRGAA